MEFYACETESEPEDGTVSRDCSNCNSGIFTTAGPKCCVNKSEECKSGGYKFWTPVVNLSTEFFEEELF